VDSTPALPFLFTRPIPSIIPSVWDNFTISYFLRRIPVGCGQYPCTPGAQVEMDHGETNWCERAARDAVLAGDAEAWRAWYTAYFDRLAEYARWRCGGLQDLADDVIQEVWLTAVRRLRAFDPGKGPFFGWLCGIAANAARNTIRARRREQKRSRPLNPNDDPSTPRADPVAIEKAERVAAALAALPDHYEVLLRAKYLNQMTVEQIAAARNDSPKAVESLLTRARQAFREAYEKSHD
jgi:RNA polymerase sigma-70 factor (ECF subfamily)